MSKKPGDWRCSCGEINFASRDYCRKCNDKKFTLFRKIEKKPGDWSCPCGEINFASRDYCRKCNAKNAKPIEKRPGDWTCPCGETNFASRDTCRKCNAKNTTVSTTIIEKKPGDWNCSCGKMNFGSRTVCFGCGKAKEGEKEKEEQEEEICVICMENRIDTVIKVCGHFGCCGLCALNMYKCPICRAAYNPDVDLLKVYKV